jgi:hypothetical protein
VKTIFITERPTQIITAIAICEQLKLVNNIQIIVANCFSDASNIVDRFSKTERQITFRLHPTYEAALNVAINELPAHIFIHWDVGFGTQRRLRRLIKKNKGEKISVFEEGIGTYRQDIYKPLKKVIFNLLGLPVNVGGSRHISDIYVYNKEKYVQNAISRPETIYEISSSLQDMFARRIDQLLYVFSSEDFVASLEKNSNDRCTIYLASWEFDESELSELQIDDGIKILKLHPHCKTEPHLEDFLIAPKSLPAELLIIFANRVFKHLLIHHNGSSVPLYINAPNIVFKNLRQIDN